MTGQTMNYASRGDSLGELPTIAVNGARLAYCERGEGEPVVFVHGSAADLRTWERQVFSFAASHRAIAYSRRYAWPNEDIPPERDDQMLPHVDDLASFLRAVDAAPAHLVGHSWGGLICLLTAIRHPELVRTLVLEEPPVLSLFVSTPPRPAELLPLLVRRPRLALAIIRFGAGTMAPAQKAFRRGDDEEGMRRFGNGVLGGEGFEGLPEARREQVRDNLGAMRAQLLGDGLPPLAAAEVREVTAPTLLVTGERSAKVLRLLADSLGELLHDVTRIEVEDASHRMHEERPHVVNEAILSFIDRAGNGRPPTRGAGGPRAGALS